MNLELSGFIYYPYLYFCSQNLQNSTILRMSKVLIGGIEGYLIMSEHIECYSYSCILLKFAILYIADLYSVYYYSNRGSTHSKLVIVDSEGEELVCVDGGCTNYWVGIVLNTNEFILPLPRLVPSFSLFHSLIALCWPKPVSFALKTDIRSEIRSENYVK